MTQLVPALSEPELVNASDCARLAVIIDCLRYGFGLPVGAVIPESLAGEAFGVLGLPFTSADASGADAAITDAPAAGLHIALDSLVVSVGTTMNVVLKEETSGTVIAGPFYILANTSLQLFFKYPRQCPVINKKLMVRASVAGNITVGANYHSI